MKWQVPLVHSPDVRIVQVFYDGDGKLSADDMRLLLDISQNMRRLFDEAEANSGEAKMRQLFGEKPKPRSFDEAFKPLMGWDSL